MKKKSLKEEETPFIELGRIIDKIGRIKKNAKDAGMKNALQEVIEELISLSSELE